MTTVDDLTPTDIRGAVIELAAIETNALGYPVTPDMVAAELAERIGTEPGRQELVNAIAGMAHEAKAALALTMHDAGAVELAGPGWEGTGYVSIPSPEPGYMELTADQRAAIMSNSLAGTPGGKRQAASAAAEVDRYLELAASTVTIHNGRGDRPGRGRQVADLQGLLPDETAFRTAGSGDAGAFPRTADQIADAHPEFFTSRRVPGVLEHHPDHEEDDPTDNRVSPKGGEASAEVVRLMHDHPAEFGREAPQSGSRTVHPKSAARRRAESARARPGRTGQPNPISR